MKYMISFYEEPLDGAWRCVSGPFRRNIETTECAWKKLADNFTSCTALSWLHKLRLSWSLYILYCRKYSSVALTSNKTFRVRFEVFTAVTMKNAVFWDVALCRSFTQDVHSATSRLTAAFFKTVRILNVFLLTGHLFFVLKSPFNTIPTEWNLHREFIVPRHGKRDVCLPQRTGGCGSNTQDLYSGGA
jgi:hypothetical protein